MSLIPFPNVPNVPGVPALPRSPAFPAAAQVALGVIQGALWRIFQVQTRWGVFDSAGNALADPSKFTGLTQVALNTVGGTSVSTTELAYSKEMKISDFPIEGGGFASYNKVETPGSANVTLCLTGSESDRTKFLNAIDQATKSTELYSVVTPEVSYIKYSIERYNYSRQSNRGATMLVVELALKEIREVSSSLATVIDIPKDAGATPTVDAGKVQPKTPDSSTLNNLATKLGL